jgi:hypothetical protein
MLAVTRDGMLGLSDHRKRSEAFVELIGPMNVIIFRQGGEKGGLPKPRGTQEEVPEFIGQCEDGSRLVYKYNARSATEVPKVIKTARQAEMKLGNMKICATRCNKTHLRGVERRPPRTCETRNR